MSEFPKNQVEITGELQREPVYRTFGDNGERTVVNMTLQVRDERNRVIFPRVVCWDDLGESVKDAKEGTRFYVKGVLVKQRDWVGSDGQKRWGTFEINADEITKLGAREGAGPKKVAPKTTAAKKMEF